MSSWSNSNLTNREYEIDLSVCCRLNAIGYWIGNKDNISRLIRENLYFIDTLILLIAINAFKVHRKISIGFSADRLKNTHSK